jgi:hypothetical protein
MRTQSGRATRRLAVSAMLAALGVVLLWLGALVEVLDLSVAALASMLAVFAVIEMGRRYAVLVYVVTALLSLLLLPVKTSALVYAVFAGYYPVLKAVLEGKLPRLAAWCLKVAIFGAAVAAALFVSARVLLFDLSRLWANWWYLLLTVPVFLLYDVALTRLISAYIQKWRARLRLPKL